MKSSTNGYLITSTYVNQGIKTEIRGGMSFAKHSVSLIKLELLADYKDKNISYNKGTMLYFKESDLGTLHWAKEIMKDGLADRDYILARIENVVLVEENN